MPADSHSANILTPSEGARLLDDERYRAFNSHMHTGEGSYDVPYGGPEGKTSAINVYRDCLAEGLTDVMITDHDSEGGLEALSKHNIHGEKENLVRAFELSIPRPHFNGIFRNNDVQTFHFTVFHHTTEQFKDLEDLAEKRNVFEVLAYLKEKDLAWVYNHPSWHAANEEFNTDAMVMMAKHSDVIEMNSSELWEQQYDIAYSLARRFDKGIVASSDSHGGYPKRETIETTLVQDALHMTGSFLGQCLNTYLGFGDPIHSTDSLSGYTLVKAPTFREGFDKIKAGESLVVPLQTTPALFFRHHMWPCIENLLAPETLEHIDFTIPLVPRTPRQLGEQPPGMYFTDSGYLERDAKIYERLERLSASGLPRKVWFSHFMSLVKVASIGDAYTIVGDKKKLLRRVQAELPSALRKYN